MNFNTHFRSTIESTLSRKGYWCKVYRFHTDFEELVRIEEISEETTPAEGLKKGKARFENDQKFRKIYSYPSQDRDIFWVYLSRKEIMEVLFDWKINYVSGHFCSPT